MVLADAVGVEAYLIGAFDLFEQVLNTLGRAHVDSTDGVGDRRDETVYADPHRDLVSSRGGAQPVA
jgi:hypothetical protein